ncbi:MAG: sporulation integral membrane protein YtvI [Bacillota bacterium]
MTDPVRHFWFSLLWMAVFLAASYLLFTYLLPYVLPFALAVFLAVLIDPWVGAVERWLRLPRGLATALVVTISTTTVVLLVVGLVTIIIYELTDLTYSWPTYYQWALRTIQEGIARYEALARSASERPELQQFLTDWLRRLSEFVNTQGTKLTGVLGFVTAVPAVIVTALITVVATFFLSRDKRIVARFLLSLLPEPWRRQVADVKFQVFGSAVGFVKAEITLVTITGLLTLIFLNLMDVKYSALLAILAALLDVLPVVGPAVLFIPWALFQLVFGSPALGVKLLLAYAATSGVRTVLEPKILGDRIGLHPLATLVGLYVGLQIFGPLGVIYGPLVVITMKAMVGAGLLPLPGARGGKTPA